MTITLASGFTRTDDLYTDFVDLDTGGKVIPSVGTQACQFQGKSNQNVCGTVEANAQDLTNITPHRDNVIRIDMCSQGGDSGSPTYTAPFFGTAYAAGMHILGTDNEEVCTTSDNTYSERIGELEVQTGLYLRVS